MKRIIAEINDKLHRDIKIKAIKEKISIKDLIIKLVKNYLNISK